MASQDGTSNEHDAMEVGSVDESLKPGHGVESKLCDTMVTKPDRHAGTGTEESQQSVKRKLLDRVARSDGHFKHQQRDEPDLRYDEKLAIARDLLDTKPSTFLTRFGKYLKAEDLVYFEAASGDYIINFLLKEIEQGLNTQANQKVVRNRRYEAMKRLVEGGQYFSDEELKYRDPLLYEQMVGRYLTDDEVKVEVDKSDLRLSSILLMNIDRMQANELYQKQKDAEEVQTGEPDSDESMDQADQKKDEDDSEEESELESEDEESGATEQISAEERAMLRADFLRTMQLRFLNGEDADFDYTKVDTNVEYDSLDMRERDEQEKYFDEEEPETLEEDGQVSEGLAMDTKCSAQADGRTHCFDVKDRAPLSCSKPDETPSSTVPLLSEK